MLDDFVFGAATSAYQIEGAWDEDGKTPSIWDTISHGDSMFEVQNGHTGDVAADHYHQYMEDVGLMKQLCLDAYRFSISWSRICTQECMCSNLKGIKFYKNLVNELKKANVEPFVTLYHWDLPQWLDDLGGWSNPKSVDYFVCYAETMIDILPDVKYWITFNEPAVFINNFWGHKNKSKAIKNVLLAHGRVAQLLHDKKRKIGISLNLMPIYPVVWGDKKDELAASNLDKMHNKVWLDPVFKGELPTGINKLFGFKKTLLRLNRDDKDIVSTPVDFLGINYYTTVNVKYNQNKPPAYYQPEARGFDRDEMDVEIRPHGIYDLCVHYLKKYYKNPSMYITENGMACSDTFVHDAKIHDKERIKYIRDHLRSCQSAIYNDANLKGYFYWSLMDNFEWLFGYNKRFGLLYVFYPTQSRVYKDSFYWYRDIISDKKFRDKELGGE